jgi:hypothetical protein
VISHNDENVRRHGISINRFHFSRVRTVGYHLNNRSSNIEVKHEDEPIQAKRFPRRGAGSGRPAEKPGNPERGADAGRGAHARAKEYIIGRAAKYSEFTEGVYNKE